MMGIPTILYIAYGVMGFITVLCFAYDVGLTKDSKKRGEAFGALGSAAFLLAALWFIFLPMYIGSKLGAIKRKKLNDKSGN